MRGPSFKLLWGLRNRNILRLVTAAGCVTPKAMRVNHGREKVQFSAVGGEPDSGSKKGCHVCVLRKPRFGGFSFVDLT